MANTLPEVPPAFKPIQHYLKTAAEYETRDPVVAYYCKLYAMQKGMDIDRKSPECRNFLRVLMDALEQMKDKLKNEEAILSELVGQAHIEDAAIKLFFFADTEDRKSKFDKNCVKAFYTSSMLLDVLTTFGPLSEELEKSRKYAKWKAAYIHNCLKSGIAPCPGPLPEASEELGISADHQFQLPKSSFTGNNPNVSPPAAAPQPHYTNQPNNKVYPDPLANFQPKDYSGQPPVDPNPGSHPNSQAINYPQPSQRHINLETPSVPTSHAHYDATTSSGSLKPDDYAQAMKYCKFASSALQYEDAKTAILNLNKALKLLTTGSE